jgi:hypothetical protein
MTSPRASGAGSGWSPCAVARSGDVMPIARSRTNEEVGRFISITQSNEYVIPCGHERSAAVSERTGLASVGRLPMDVGNHREHAVGPTQSRRRNLDSESGDERLCPERPRASGFVPEISSARRSRALIARHDDRMPRIRGGQTAPGVLFHENGIAEHDVPAVVSAGQDCRRLAVLEVALCSGCFDRITPNLTQHADIRPSRQGQDDRQNSCSKHGISLSSGQEARQVAGVRSPQIPGFSSSPRARERVNCGISPMDAENPAGRRAS